MKLQHGESYRTDLIVTVAFDKDGNPIKKAIPTIITKKGERLWLDTPFCKPLTDELKKCLAGMKWHGREDKPIKKWSCYDNNHNWFQIEFLEGKNPYQRYDLPLINIPYEVQPDGRYKISTGRERLVYPHQHEIASHFLTRHYSLIAGEMGVGKSLAAIVAMELSGVKDWLVVAPASALLSLQLEFQKWDSPIKPTFVTYSSLEKYIANWPPGKPVHQGIVFDESAWIKTPTAKRSQAAAYLADCVRNEWGVSGYVIEMSGAPAPKSPLDWYNQCEIACPGFLMEGDYTKFKDRMAIVIQRENEVTGGVYPELKSWRDNDRKCNVCGELKDSLNHDHENNLYYHDFVPCVNEVANLNNRMRGLVIVKTKKECLGLPDKIYKEIEVKPSTDILRAARLIVKKSSTTIKALTLLRELSDGFQYEEIQKGESKCPLCDGQRTRPQSVYVGPDKTYDFLAELGLLQGRTIVDEFELDGWVIDPVKFPQYYEIQVAACEHCDGTGSIPLVERIAHQLPCPKEDELISTLDEHSDIGRLVTFAGFTGSVDRCIEVVKRLKWDWIRIDGRGFLSSFAQTRADMLRVFQDPNSSIDRICVVGNPEAAGTGLTLTRSPTIFYYSNTFNANARIQSEDRIHRIGMDSNRGATIKDIFHLPTDRLVFENLRKKRELQDISLGTLEEAILL